MTLTTSSDSHIIKTKKYLKPPIIGTSIKPKNASDLRKLFSNLSKIRKMNPSKLL